MKKYHKELNEIHRGYNESIGNDVSDLSRDGAKGFHSMMAMHRNPGITTEEIIALWDTNSPDDPWTTFLPA